jgi:hypothetical protein
VSICYWLVLSTRCDGWCSVCLLIYFGDIWLLLQHSLLNRQNATTE